MKDRTALTVAAAVAGLLCAVGASFAAQQHRIVLFDFDSGIKGWRGNPWGGGKCSVAPAPDPKFGRGALRVTFEGVKRGADGVSPYLPLDADWQEQQWRYISMWVRGPGFPFQVRFGIEAVGPDGQAIHYSRYFYVREKRWRRVLIPGSSMFRRHKVPFSQAKIKCLLFGGGGTGYYDVDAVALQGATHFVPLTPLGDTGPAPLRPRLEHFPDDTYEVCIDTSLFPAPEIHVTATVTWPGEKPVEYGLFIKPPEQPAETRVKLPGSPVKAGTGRLALVIQARDGQVMFRGAYSFGLAFGQPMKPPSQWCLIPQPKYMAFKARYCYPTPERGWRPGAPGYHQAERAAPDETGVAERIVGVGQMRVRDELQPARVPGAYVLDISPTQLLERGRGDQGLSYAEWTVEQLAASEELISGQERWPCVEVADQPSLGIRAVSMSLPTSRWGYPNDPPVDPAFFEKFLDRVILAHKFNFVVLLVDQGMKLASHPEVPGPAAWPQETVRQLVAHLKENGVEVAPCLNSLGHGVWLLASHPELREDGDIQTICTSHPNSHKVMGEIYDEVLRVFEPRYFHIGMDEVRWKTLRVPEEKRCKLCAGKEKADIFAEQVRWLHDFLAKRGVKTMMWGDMLLEAHNGGPPFYVSRAISKIPKDVIICNWSCAVDPLSLSYFWGHGFRSIIKSNSLGATPADAPYIIGNMYGCWAKSPWLVELPGGYSNYNFLSMIQAAHYSWNLHPNVFSPAVGLEPDFFYKRRLALARIALADCRRPGAIYGWARQFAEKELSDVPPVPKAGLQLKPADLGAAKGKWLVLVAAFKCSDEQMAVLRERLKDKHNWLGAPAGTVQFTYADAVSREVPVRFGYHFRAAGASGLPFVYGAVALNDGALWYAIPLANPRPTAQIKSVAVVPDPKAAEVHIAGARLFAD